MLARRGQSWIRCRARPEREAVVMLGSQYNVFRAGILEDLGPYIRVPLLAFAVEGLGKAIVVMVRAEMFAVIYLRRGPIETHGVVVPLGVGIRLKGFRGDFFGEVELRKRRPTGHGVESPMNEDAQLRVIKPPWERMLVEGLDRRFIVR